VGQLIGTFFLPLISGFLLSVAVPWLRFHTLRASNYLLLFQFALIGLILCTAGHFFLYATSELYKVLPPDGIIAGLADSLKSLWIKIVQSYPFARDEKIPDGAYLSFILALIIAVYFWARERKSSSRFRADQKIIAREAGTLEKLLNYSLIEKEPVLITLSSRKVYLGVVTRLPILSASKLQALSVEIVPLSSGYREKDSLKFIETNSYKIFFDAALLKEGEALDYISPDGQQRTITYEEGQKEIEKIAVSFYVTQISTVSRWSDLHTIKSPVTSSAEANEHDQTG
jgi:hypothetical protein